MNGSFVFVSGEANFIHKVRNRILTEKERHNKSARTHTHIYISLIYEEVTSLISKTILYGVSSQQFSGVGWTNIAFSNKLHIMDTFLSRFNEFTNYVVNHIHFCHYNAPLSPLENQGLKLPSLSNLPTTEILVKTNSPSFISSHSCLVMLYCSGVSKYSFTHPLKGSIPCSCFKWLVRFLVIFRPHSLHIPRTHTTSTHNYIQNNYLSFLHTHITIVDCKHAEELKNHPKWKLQNNGV